MSDLAPGRQSSGGSGVFRPLTVALMLAIGVLGFVGTLVLGAYAPDLRSGNNGGTHALSNAAVGFSGIVELARATGRHPAIIRDETQLGSVNLLVATPDDGYVDVSKVLYAHGSKPLLMVMPKWQTVPDPKHPGWVRFLGLLDRSNPESILAPATKFAVHRRVGGNAILPTAARMPRDIRFKAPHPVQTITGKNMEVLIAGPDGKEAVLARIGRQPLYILADPDLLSNLGMKDPDQARSALRLLDWLGPDHPTAIEFDVTLNGLGHAESPLKLAFEPPFLAMTLALAAVLALLGLHAFGQFGAPRRRERAIAFGKAALVDNSAALVRKARRERRLGGRYVAVIRDRAVHAFGISPRLKGSALDDYLDGLGGRARFTDLAYAAEDADDNHELLAAARALHAWQQEKLG